MWIWGIISSPIWVLLSRRGFISHWKLQKGCVISIEWKFAIWIINPRMWWSNFRRCKWRSSILDSLNKFLSKKMSWNGLEAHLTTWHPKSSWKANLVFIVMSIRMASRWLNTSIRGKPTIRKISGLSSRSTRDSLAILPIMLRMTKTSYFFTAITTKDLSWDLKSTILFVIWFKDVGQETSNWDLLFHKLSRNWKLSFPK